MSYHLKGMTVPPLSSPHHLLDNHYAIIVIGSGYGGAIIASRLSRAGQQICLLEKGREFAVGEYPNNPSEIFSNLQINSFDGFHGSPQGLYHVYLDKEISALVGCGLGGTSLINANVALRADKRVFEDSCWPQALKDDLTGLMEESYQHAQAMLKPQPYPDTFPSLTKMQALQQSAASLGQPFNRPPITVNFEEGMNHVGVIQHPCQLCGDCVSGCNYAAKNTLTMNYLPDAKYHGAMIFSQIDVQYLEKTDEKWAIYYYDQTSAKNNLSKQLRFLTADFVVLAAGTLGSTEILLRSKMRYLELSNQVGQQFSGNGNVLAFAYNNPRSIHGIGFGTQAPEERTPVGPSITGSIDMRNRTRLEDSFTIEEGAIPGGAAAFLPHIFALSAHYTRQNTGPIDFVQENQRMIENTMWGTNSGAMEHTQTFFVTSHDNSNGQLFLANDQLRISWAQAEKQPIFAKIDAALATATHSLGGSFISKPIWTQAAGHTLITMHPLGGCSMSEDARNGVVNHKGQVFCHSTGNSVYENLYICDGSIIPRSLGVHPLLTISALAERCAALIANDKGWTINYEFSSLPQYQEAIQGTSLAFTETMRGRLSTAILDDYEKSYADAKSTPFEFTLTITILSLQKMLTASRHLAEVTGTVSLPAFSKSPLIVTQGLFQLFANDKAQINTHKILYRLILQSVEGDFYELEGFKLIHNNPGSDIWEDSIILYATLYQINQERRLCGKGMLKILLADFIQQLTAVQVLNTIDPVKILTAKAQFGHFFAGILYQIYSGTFTKTAYFNPQTTSRQKRKLRLKTPESHFVRTPDQQELRLTHYHGGKKGPVILSHGLGASSLIFSIDTIDTTLVEYLCEHGYDVWLLDYRGSIALPTTQTFYNADTIALYDYPTAVAEVRKLTKANDVQMIAHCFGAITLCMSMLAGLQGVRSALFSQIAAHMVVDAPEKMKAGLYLPSFLNKLGVTSLTAYANIYPDWEQTLFDLSLTLPNMTSEQLCHLASCRRITFLYGQLYEHAQLNPLTHEYLHEMFGTANIASFEQLALMIKQGHVVSAHNEEIYMLYAKRLALPITFLHGEKNRCFLPASTEKTYQLLREINGPVFYKRHVIPDYGHMDCIFGKNALKDVYPLILQHLEENVRLTNKTIIT